MARPRLDMVPPPQVMAARHHPATASSSSSNDLLLAEGTVRDPAKSIAVCCHIGRLPPAPCIRLLLLATCWHGIKGLCGSQFVASATPASRLLDVHNLLAESTCWSA